LHVARARDAIRIVERFTYHAISVAETEEQVAEARSVMRLVVGLRRKLDGWKAEDA
jgi:hypothetical protein